MPLLVVSLISIGCSGATTTNASVPKSWAASTPEEQGMDSELLAQAATQIASKYINLHSMIVMRHGKVVVEKYFGSYTGDQTVPVYSVTKGVVAALIGIAIDQGSIDNVNHKVLDYFPNLTIDNNDANKQAITIENLLTMSSGFAWSDDTDINKMISNGSQVQYVLGLPMAAAPGQRFNYNTGAPGLLCAILKKATGMSPTDFANANLFGPLGLTGISWDTDPSGLEIGGYGIRMSPREMAVLGQLFLQGGEWDGKQVIPASWVKASLESHIDPMMQSQKRSGYGYFLWLQTHGAISFQGAFGQYITMVPAQDLVVVFTADLSSYNFQQPYDVFESYILPAVESNDPLPPNPAASANLEAALKALP
jgi:CubicO group peptidase (beta-lactamase class C family)